MEKQGNRGDQTISQVVLGPQAQHAPNADRPGSYRLAMRVNNGEIIPDSTINVELYIVGYGHIESAKLSIYPPPYLIDVDWTKFTHGIGEYGSGYAYGAREDSFSGDEGGVIRLSGGVNPNSSWPSPSQFYDVTYDPNDSIAVHVIASEIKSVKAPIEFLLQTRKKIPAGVHQLRFYLTYFNGEQWQVAANLSAS